MTSASKIGGKYAC